MSGLKEILDWPNIAQHIPDNCPHQNRGIQFTINIKIAKFQILDIYSVVLLRTALMTERNLMGDQARQGLGVSPPALSMFGNR